MKGFTVTFTPTVAGRQLEQLGHGPGPEGAKEPVVHQIRRAQIQRADLLAAVVLALIIARRGKDAEDT